MSKNAKAIEKMRNNPSGVRYSDLARICHEAFGEPRSKGTSHHTYRTPWQGDPRVNIQPGKNGMAKPYQVKQVLAALDKLAEVSDQ